MLAGACQNCRLSVVGCWYRIIAAHHFHSTTNCRGYKITENLRDCYQLLNVSEKSSIVEVKEAYIELAKVYHPDSKSKQADSNKFSQVQQAYNAICLHIEKKEKRARKDDDETSNMTGSGMDFDIKHTAPQHRQYLEYEGIGFGTPSQRQRQYQKHRAAKASQAASDHRIYKIAMTDEKGLVVKDKRAARKIRTTNVIERLVEDLIQDSMAKGEFDNLPGKGKPLPAKTDYCPYMDVSTHHLNQILVNNGYVPEWIQLEKDIRNSLKDAKKALLRERLKLGARPLNAYNEEKWEGLQIEFVETVSGINRKVNDFNLIVPLIRLQMVHIQPEKEIAKVVDEFDQLENDLQVEKQENQKEDIHVVNDDVAIFASKIFQGISNYMTKLMNVVLDKSDDQRVKMKSR